MTTSALGPRRGGCRRPGLLPADLAEPRGPLTGIVRLPLRIYASRQGPARSFDLSNEAERIELYEIVLTDGTAEDACMSIARSCCGSGPGYGCLNTYDRCGSLGLVSSPHEPRPAARADRADCLRKIFFCPAAGPSNPKWRPHIPGIGNIASCMDVRISRTRHSVAQVKSAPSRLASVRSLPLRGAPHSPD
jgi:hypothetical protein